MATCPSLRVWRPESTILSRCKLSFTATTIRWLCLFAEQGKVVEGPSLWPWCRISACKFGGIVFVVTRGLKKKYCEGQLQCSFQVTKKLHCCAIKLVYCQHSSCRKIKWHIKLYCWIRHGLVSLRAMRTLALCACLCLLVMLSLQHSVQLLYELLVPSSIAHAHNFTGFVSVVVPHWTGYQMCVRNIVVWSQFCLNFCLSHWKICLLQIRSYQILRFRFTIRVQ